MREYLELIHEKGIHVVNPLIGKMVMQKHNLTHEGLKNEEPKSTLISSYTIFN